MHHNKHTLKGRLFLKLYILSKCDQIFLSNSWASCLAFALVFCFLTKCNRLRHYRAYTILHYPHFNYITAQTIVALLIHDFC